MATATTRIMTGLIAVAAFLAVAMAVRPEWLTGQQPRSAAAPTIQLMSQPDERSEVVRRRILAKSDIIARLIAEELTLIEAANLFHYVNTRPAGIEDQSWKLMPGHDDGERLCRQVLNWVETSVRQTFVPSEAEARLEKLERELSQHIAAHGGVQLDAR
jgi:hypothetical protein